MVAPKDNKTTSTSAHNQKLEQWAWEEGKNRHDKRRYETKVDRETGEIIVNRDKLRSPDPSRNEYEWKIVEQAHQSVADAWAASIEVGREKLAKKGKPLNGFREVMDLPPDLVAYIGLSMLMEGVASQLEHQMLLQKLGQRIEHMAFDQWLQAKDSDLSRKLWQRSHRTFNTVDKRFMSVRAIAESRGYKWTDWTRTTQVYVGTLVYNVVMEHAGVFKDYTEYKKMTNKKTGKDYIRQRELVTLTDEAFDEILQLEAKAEWMQPMFPPMTEKPIPWGKGRNAPYNDPHLSDLCRFVRRAGLPQQRRIDQAIADGKMETVIEAVNTVQDVPLRLNPYIVEAINWCWAENLTPGKFPDSQEVPPPESANDNQEDPQVVKLAKYAERQRIKLNHGCRSSVATMASMLATMVMLEDRDFYLPHSLDFRSRIYPIPSFNHYGADHQKALFYSARPKRVGAVGAQWLYVHIANCADFKDENGVKLTKKSINDRIAWVQDNWDMLLAVGEVFESTYDVWSEADKPFMFLAACRELVGLQKDGYDHKCGLFVAADGTNSGMQHLSAAMRHRQNGMMVNLTEADPDTPPADIYQFIADKVTEKVKWDAKSTNPAESEPAKLWLTFCGGKIDRSVVKRNVMTFGYNSNAYGMTDQIMDDLMKPLFTKSMKEKTPHPFAVDEDMNGFRAAKYLAHITFGIIRENLEAASAGMDFFKGCVNATSAAGKHIAWESPLGFPFAQNYRHYDVDRIKPSMYTRGIKRRKQVSVMRDDRDNVARVQRADSENGISANAIHMMDATHMMMTIVQLKYDGVEDMMMIHDSFSVMPADMDVLWSAVRETFVTLYRDYDLYEDVRRQIEPLVEERLIAETQVLEELRMELNAAKQELGSDEAHIYRQERNLFAADLTPEQEQEIEGDIEYTRGRLADTAADIERLEKEVKEQEKVVAVLTLPDPPEPGDLDLEEVLRSFNCFH